MKRAGKRLLRIVTLDTKSAFNSAKSNCIMEAIALGDIQLLY